MRRLNILLRVFSHLFAHLQNSVKTQIERNINLSDFINNLIEKRGFQTAHQNLVIIYLSEISGFNKWKVNYNLHTKSELVQEGFYINAEKSIETCFIVVKV